MMLHPQKDVEHHPNGFHLGPDHAGAAKEREKPGEHPRPLSIGLPHDAADGDGAGKTATPGTRNLPMSTIARLNPNRVRVVLIPAEKALAALPEE